MSDAHNHRASDPVRLELIEANVDMAFSLVDDARTQCHEGNAAREDADKVLRNIEDRLWKVDVPPSASFRPLVEELRKEIRAAASRVRLAPRSILPSRRLVVSFFLTLSPIREAHVRQRRT